MNIVPAPQSFEVELDAYSLLVPDLSKPVWFGVYYTGKLGIYKAEVIDNKHSDSKKVQSLNETSVTYICTITETGKADFLTHTSYEKDVPLPNIVAHLQANLWTVYNAKLEDCAEVTLVPASTTLH